MKLQFDCTGVPIPHHYLLIIGPRYEDVTIRIESHCVHASRVPVELPVNLEAHYKLLGGGGAAGEAAGEELADLAEAELGGAVARGGVLPRAAHGDVLRATGGKVLGLRFVVNASEHESALRGEEETHTGEQIGGCSRRLTAAHSRTLRTRVEETGSFAPWAHVADGLCR